MDVSYFCLKGEATAEDIHDLEFYFGGLVLLRFEPECSVWVTWDENVGWSRHFSVCAITDILAQSEFEQFSAGSVDLWKPLNGAELRAFDILGQSGVPNVIRLSFDAGSVLLGTGYKGHFGDGDDVFARPDTRAYLAGSEEVIWSSGGNSGR